MGNVKKSPFQQKMDEILPEIAKKNIENGQKSTLLLHACCGPCSSYVMEYLSDFFDITILYYNPNIYPKEEYERRLAELENFLPRFSPAVLNKVKIVKLNYEPQDFYNAVDVKSHPERAKEAEKGERCYKCYELRLKKSFEFAKEKKFDYFCTTLSISPFKDAAKINEIGERISSAADCKTKWLFSDFKKKGGFKRSLELSEEYGLYRQQYCGCVYSKTNTEEFRKQRDS